MDDLLSGVTGIASLAFGSLALALGIFFPVIAPWLVQFEGEAFDLYVTYGRMALFINVLFVFGNAYGQYLITVQRYWIYGITPILYTLGTIVGTLFLTPIYGSLGPMLGTLGGAVTYVVVRFAALLWSGYRPSLRLWHPDIRELGWLMLPRMLALGALHFELLLFDTIASGLGSGAVTINAYARNFQSVLIGVVGIALAQSAYSMLSQAAAKREAERFWIYMKKGLLIVLAFTIPGAVVLWLVAPVAAWLVHLSDVLPVFATCLGLYAISIPFESVNHLLLRSFYALKNTAFPAVFSVLNGLMAIVVSWQLAPTLGVYALALGFTAGQLLQTAGLAMTLRGVARRKL